MADAPAVFPPSIDAIDRVVHDPTRFRILSYLSIVESADFLFFMQQLGVTQGNLSSHMARLEAVGYVHVEKGFENKRPKTVFRLAPDGRAAVEQYAGHMQQLLDGLHRSLSQTATRRRKRAAALKPRLI